MTEYRKDKTVSEPHERIWAKTGYDSWGQYGHWYADSGGIEYVLADRIKELEAKLERERKAHEKEIYVWQENYAALERKLAESEAILAKAEAAIYRITPYLSASLEVKQCGPEYVEACNKMFEVGRYTIAELQGEK